jgi:hypothetical protein
VNKNQDLHAGQIITGSLFSEPMRIATVCANGPGTWVAGMVGLQTERFRKVTLTVEDIEKLTILDTTFNYGGDGQLLCLGIVDEAHRMSAADETPKSLRYKLGELLRDTTGHLLLLTATPHKGDPENFSSGELRLIEARFPWHEVKKVQHCWLEISAMTQPMKIRDDLSPYGGKLP